MQNHYFTVYAILSAIIVIFSGWRLLRRGKISIDATVIPLVLIIMLMVLGALIFFPNGFRK